jgi:hypothetical protein
MIPVKTQCATLATTKLTSQGAERRSQAQFHNLETSTQWGFPVDRRRAGTGLGNLRVANRGHVEKGFVRRHDARVSRDRHNVEAFSMSWYHVERPSSRRQSVRPIMNGTHRTLGQRGMGLARLLELTETHAVNSVVGTQVLQDMVPSLEGLGTQRAALRIADGRHALDVSLERVFAAEELTAFANKW